MASATNSSQSSPVPSGSRRPSWAIRKVRSSGPGDRTRHALVFPIDERSASFFGHGMFMLGIPKKKLMGTWWSSVQTGCPPLAKPYICHIEFDRILLGRPMSGSDSRDATIQLAGLLRRLRKDDTEKCQDRCGSSGFRILQLDPKHLTLNLQWYSNISLPNTSDTVVGDPLLDFRCKSGPEDRPQEMWL